MGVLMQAFHWDCPRVDSREFAWWTFVREPVPSLARASLISLWLPPVHKAANISGPSPVTAKSAGSCWSSTIAAISGGHLGHDTMAQHQIRTGSLVERN